MSMLYTAGQYSNLLSRALSVTPTPAVDALFPATNLYDGRPSRPMKFGSNAANPEVRFDLAAFTPAGAGTQTITVRAGERRRVTGTGASTVTIRNLSTLKYLTSAGAWQAGSANVLSGAGAYDYQVESYAVCQVPYVALQITLAGVATVADWPRWNALVVVGHNLDVGLTCELRSSTDNFAANNVLEVTGAIAQPGFFMYKAAGVTSRYGRILLTGTNTATGWLGEVVPCWLESATKAPDVGLEIRYEEPQIRNTGPWGEAYVYPLATRPRRIVQMQFDNAAATGAVEMRNDIVMRSRGGAWPMVLAPVDAEAEVYYGRLSDKWSETRYLSARYRNDLVLSEDGIAEPLA